jgi:hypothetical protein
MQLTGSRGQQTRDFSYRADGSVTGAATPSTLVLAESKSRSFLFFQNISSGGMYLEFGCPRVTAVLTGGVVTSFTIQNAGFGYTLPPRFEAFGGGNGGNSSFLGVGQVGYPTPNVPVKARCVLTAGALTSLVIDNPGSGYVTPPYIALINNPLDLMGCADPSIGGGSGMYLSAGQSITLNGTACTTDQIAVYASGSGAQLFTCMYMP